MVFAGLYSVEGHEYQQLHEALGKLQLNDSSLFFEPETSTRASASAAAEASLDLSRTRVVGAI
jgi:translation elongation factor EF-4